MSVYSIATLLQNSTYGYTEPMKNITSLNQGLTVGKEKLYQMFIERVAFGHIRVGSPWTVIHGRKRGKYFGRPFSKYLSMNIGIESGWIYIEVISDKEPYREVYRIPYSEEAV